MSFREMRKRAGLSAVYVAAELGVSDAAVYMWETGATMPRTEKLVELANMYGCTIDELLREEAE